MKLFIVAKCTSDGSKKVRWDEKGSGGSDSGNKEGVGADLLDPGDQGQTPKENMEQPLGEDLETKNDVEINKVSIGEGTGDDHISHQLSDSGDWGDESSNEKEGVGNPQIVSEKNEVEIAVVSKDQD